MSTEEIASAYLHGQMNRREFLRALAAIGVTAGTAFELAQALGGLVGTASAESLDATGASQGPVALSPGEYRTLQAIAARIFPTTDTPGATEAGAADYVDRALAGDYDSYLFTYHKGLSDLDQYCAATMGAAFAELSASQQDAALRTLQSGGLGLASSDQAFFQLVRRHVLEGVFCEPIYGGNRNLVGWKLVGFPGQQFGYADPYINKIIDLAPIAQSGVPQQES